MGYKQDLMSEHRAIERMLGIVDAMRLKLAQGAEVPTGDLGDALEFIRTFADTCHHHKEEALLFPAMEAAGVANEGGPIGQLLEEHRQGRAHVATMVAALESADGPAIASNDDLARAMLAYTTLLRGHIGTEDTQTFPLADEVLSETTKESLAEQFDDYERKIMGPELHEHFHEVLDRMERSYGVMAQV